MAREIVRPDPVTEQREIARLQARMQRIEQWKANRGGPQVDFRMHVRQTREQYNAKVREVLDDPRLPERTRYEMVGELTREYSTAMSEAHRDAREAYAAEVDQLDRIAHPAPQRGRTADQIAETREMREDLERGWSSSQESVLEGYRQAVRLGDTLSMEVHEKYGREFIKDQGLRQEFAAEMAPQRKARMSPQQRTAVEQLESLRAEEPGMMIGMEHQVHLAAEDRKNATSGRPVVTRDDIEGRRNELRRYEEAGNG